MLLSYMIISLGVFYYNWRTRQNYCKSYINTKKESTSFPNKCEWDTK